MPNPALSQPVTSPVRPNSTTSASAITNGGVMIGRIDISFRSAGVALSATLHDERQREPEQRRQHADEGRQHRRVDRHAAARTAAQAVDAPDVRGEEPLEDQGRHEPALRVLDGGEQRPADRIEDEDREQRRDDDDDGGDDRIAAEDAAPRDGIAQSRR